MLNMVATSYIDSRLYSGLKRPQKLQRDISMVDIGVCVFVAWEAIR